MAHFEKFKGINAFNMIEHDTRENTYLKENGPLSNVARYNVKITIIGTNKPNIQVKAFTNISRHLLPYIRYQQGRN